MSAWISLTKKELRLGLPAFMLPVVVFFIAVGIGAYLGYRSNFTWEAVTGIGFLAMIGLVFYLPYYLLYSLSSERKKLHLWLHNPLPGYSLLLAKIVAGLLSMAVTLLVYGGVLWIAFNLAEKIPAVFPFASMLKLALLGGIHLFLFTISLGVWFLFFWFIFLLCTRFSRTFLSFVISFLLFIATISFFTWVGGIPIFGGTPIYDVLTHWGELHLSDVVGSIQFSNGVEIGVLDTFELKQATVYLGEYVFETIVTLILFGASVWLLDNKVEV